MSLSDVAIKRPVFTSMMALCLIVLGIMGARRLGTDLFPDVTFPVVIVTTVYKGAGPGEIETQVTKPLEDSIAGISGIDKMHSWSRENASFIAVQFKLTESLDRAVQEVRDKVAAAQYLLPHDVDVPKALPVAQSKSGSQVRLSEVARVSDGVAERRTIATLNGKDAIIVEVVKQPGSNTIKVADQVKKALTRLSPEMGSHFQASLLIDQSALI